MPVKTAIVSIDVDCMHGHVRLGPTGKSLGQVDPHYINMSYNRWLPRFLDLLAATDIKGTFFLVADFTRRPEAASTIRRIVAEGHEIASHTVSHAGDMCLFDTAAKRPAAE